MPACGPPSSLSPEKQTRSAPARRLSAGVGSSPTRPSAPEPRSSTSGNSLARATAASSPSRGCSENPTTRKFDWCTRRSEGRLRPDRPFVIGGARAIRRSDFDETRARPCEHVGYAEAVADLDELAARDDHLASFRESREREEHGRGVVVDDERGVGTGQAPEEGREVILARAAFTSLEVVLEVRVARPDLRHSPERSLRQRCAAEVRVHEDPRGVQHASQRWLPRTLELGEDGVDDSARIATRPDLRPRPLESRTGGREDELARLGGQPLVAEQLVNRGQIAKLHAESVGTSSRSSDVS